MTLLMFFSFTVNLRIVFLFSKCRRPFGRDAEKRKTMRRYTVKEKNMSKVISRDGTAIAFDRSGQGPVLILVTGAIATRSDAASLAARLSPHFSVFAYDRRGRGENGDTPPYAVEREVEDLDALITEAGGSAFVYGHSSGAVLALEAARRLSTKITKLPVYEPPFIVDDSRPPVPKDYWTRLTQPASSDGQGGAVQ